MRISNLIGTRRRWLLVYGPGIGLSLSAVVIFALRGTMAHFIVVYAAAMWLLVPSAVILLISLAVWRWRQSMAALTVATISVLVAEIAFLQFPGLYIGNIVADRDIRQAQEYCEMLVPSLDAYHKRHGTYPETLPELQDVRPPLPRVLGRMEFYRGTGQSFKFTVNDGRYMFRWFELDSAERQWRQFDD